MSDKEQFIWRALYTWWADSALKLIEESYGYRFTDSDVHFKNITVSFADKPSNSDLAWNAWSDRDSKGKADGKVDKITLTVNMAHFKNIDTTNPNVKGSSKFYLDKTLAHELTHTITYAKILCNYDLPTFITEGLAELTIGIDDERADNIKYLAANPTALEEYLNTSKTPDNSTSTPTNIYVAGYDSTLKFFHQNSGSF